MQCCGPGMIYSGSRSSSEFLEFRIRIHNTALITNSKSALSKLQHRTFEALVNRNNSLVEMQFLRLSFSSTEAVNFLDYAEFWVDYVRKR